MPTAAIKQPSSSATTTINRSTTNPTSTNTARELLGHVLNSFLIALPSRQARANLKCLRSYQANCLKYFPKQFFNVIFNGVRKEVQSRCATKSTRRTFLTQFRALNKVAKPLNALVFKLINFYESVINSANLDQQIASICCGHLFNNHEMFSTITHHVS